MIRAGNFYESTLAAELAINAVEIPLSSLVGLPVFAAPDYAYLVIGDPDEIATCEIVKMTANTGSGTQPITRAQDGTTAATWAAGTKVFCAFCDAALVALQTLGILSLEQGDVVYYDGEAFARLAHGTAGQALLSGGHGANPAWGTVSGKILQVVAATHSTEVVTSSESYVDTGLAASITPSAASSKVLAIIFDNVGTYNANSDTVTAGGFISIVRNSTTIIDRYFCLSHGATAINKYLVVPLSLAFLDSPNSTSAVTYKTQIKATSVYVTAQSQYTNKTAVMFLLEVAS